MDIFDVQRFSVYDGPGIRTVFFLKGCSMRCAWCHNPEGLLSERQMLFLQNKCIGCGTCRDVCPANADLLPCLSDKSKMPDVCMACSRCADECPSQALQICGQNVSVEEVVSQAVRDASFYRSLGGGVTFSGGEPLLQAKQVWQACRSLHERGIHCAMETAGNVETSILRDVLGEIDLIIFDLKAIDPKVHRECTGVGNERILSNIKAVSSSGKPLWIRLPFIPGWNDSADEWKAKGQFLAALPRVDRVEIMPYHDTGKSKYAALDMRYRAEDCLMPSHDQTSAVEKLLQTYLPSNLFKPD